MFFIIILIYLIYNSFYYKKQVLSTRNTIPKICIYINNVNSNDILTCLKYQNYPKNLFDVYNCSTIKNYKFKTFSSSKIEGEYDMICIIDNIIDVNYLNNIVKDYLNGYDIIISNTSNLLIYNFLNKISNNKIFNSNFSFNYKIYKENIINLNNNFLLRKFLSSKYKNIKYNTSSKTNNKINKIEYSFKINGLNKRFFIYKLLFYILLLFVIITKYSILEIILFLYILSLIHNSFFLFKNDKLTIKVIYFPISLIVYLSSSLIIKLATFKPSKALEVIPPE